jgi:hypothetical protein
MFKNGSPLTIKFVGPENIVVLNGAVWKKHRMVSQSPTRILESRQSTNLTFFQIANPAFHRSMPVKLFAKQSEKMMLQFEKESDGLDNIDVPNLLQR